MRAIEAARRAGIEHRVTAYASAGRRGLQLELSPTDLERLTSAIRAHISRDLSWVDIGT